MVEQGYTRKDLEDKIRIYKLWFRSTRLDPNTPVYKEILGRYEQYSKALEHLKRHKLVKVYFTLNSPLGINSL